MMTFFHLLPLVASANGAKIYKLNGKYVSVKDGAFVACSDKHNMHALKLVGNA